MKVSEFIEKQHQQLWHEGFNSEERLIVILSRLRMFEDLQGEDGFDWSQIEFKEDGSVVFDGKVVE